MIYYGDEVGLEGDNDPGCRGTMPWDEGQWNHELLASIRDLIANRRAHRAFTRGTQRVVALSDDVVRLDHTVDGTTASVVVNRGSVEFELAGVAIPANAAVILAEEV